MVTKEFHANGFHAEYAEVGRRERKDLTPLFFPEKTQQALSGSFSSFLLPSVDEGRLLAFVGVFIRYFFF
jgi:hypothetical protein